MINPLPVFVAVILPLALVWGAGYVARRVLDLDPKPFSRLGLYLLTAPLIFTSLMESSITAGEAGRILLVAVLVMALLWLLSAGLIRLLRLPAQEGSAFQLAAILTNTVNYGFPATLLALGQAGLERAVVYAVAHAVLANTVGVYIAARGQAGGVGQALRQVLRIPMAYAVVLALLLRWAGVSLDGTVTLWGSEIALLPSLYRAVELLAQAAIPIFSLVLGMQLGGQNQHDGAPEPRQGGWTSPVLAGLMRLVVSPALAWGLVRLVGLTGISAQATILEAAMPSAVISVILATEFDTQPRFVTQVVVGTTLCSMLTLTILLSIGIG